MHGNAKQMIKDATAIGLVATSGGLFVLRACRAENALSRAGRNAINGAILVGPLAGALAFAVSKDSKDRYERDEALEATAEWGAVCVLAAGALSGLASLAWDAFHA